MVAGHKRFLTLIGLTFLVATMVMVTQFKVSQNGYMSRRRVISTHPLEAGSTSKPQIMPPANLKNVVPPKVAETKLKSSKFNLTRVTGLSLPSSQKVPPSVATPKLNETVQASVGLINPSSNEAAKIQPEKRLMSKQNDRYELTEEELAETEKFLIDKPKLCDDDLGASLDLLVVVTSAVNNFEQRQAIRETWGQFAIERGAILVFLVGKSNSSQVTQRLFAEEKLHEDIIQAAFLDSYFNLTLKTLSMMQWIAKNCRNVKYAMKVDDDMFVNMQMAVDFSETRTYNKVIIGRIAKQWSPHRDKNSKWYIPPQLYNATYYPNFATGPSYIFTGDAVLPLLKQAKKVTPLFLEDVYMTGIVAEKAKIRRLNYSLFKNTHLNVNKCNFPRMITSHKHSPDQIRKLWKNVYETSNIACFKPRSTKVRQKEKKKNG